jgi:hypothetical protein
VPPVEIAICTGERSMIAGMMKLDSSRSSTTLQGIRAPVATSETLAFTARSFVAATASHLPSRSEATNSRATCVHAPRCTASASSTPIPGATIVTTAPASASSANLRAATSPPPTSSTGLSLISRNSGK